MFSLFGKSASINNVARASWDVCRWWPNKNGAAVRKNFAGSFEKEIQDVLTEIVYYLCFATDYAFYCQLEKQPKVEKALRDAFRSNLVGFVKEHGCEPVPRGDWVDDGLVWVPTDDSTELAADLARNDPTVNLMTRLNLYGRSLDRRDDRPPGERSAHILAALCGAQDSRFILYAMPLFLERWTEVQEALARSRIK
jgi:hypothetical protein